MTREQMINKLIEWNPHWNVEKIKSWTPQQLKKVYNKEVAKTVQLIRQNLGLSS